MRMIQCHIYSMRSIIYKSIVKLNNSDHVYSLSGNFFNNISLRNVSMTLERMGLQGVKENQNENLKLWRIEEWLKKEQSSRRQSMAIEFAFRFLKFVLTRDARNWKE